MYQADHSTSLRKTHDSHRARALLCDAVTACCIVCFVLMLLLATALARSAAAAEADRPAMPGTHVHSVLGGYGDTHFAFLNGLVEGMELRLQDRASR